MRLLLRYGLDRLTQLELRTPSSVLSLALLLLGAFPLAAQPPLVNGVSGNKKRYIVHDGTTAPQRFPPDQVNLIVPNSYRGATVYWTATPFQHTKQPQFQADVELSLRIVRSLGEARWVAVKSLDVTNLANGDQECDVIAASNRSGHAQAELQVSFIESPGTIVAEGGYEARVTITITEN